MGLDERGLVVHITCKDTIFFFSKASRSAPEPTQLPIQWVSDVFYPGVKRAGREATTHLHLVHERPSFLWPKATPAAVAWFTGST